LGVVNVFGQLPEYQLSRMREQEGLRVSHIQNITTDKEGFMWLTSQAHIQRFDGKHRKYFPFVETLQKTFIDYENRKWAITRNSVFLFNEVNQNFNEVPMDTNKESLVVGIYENEMKDVCLIKANGFYKHNKQLNIFEWQNDKHNNKNRSPITLSTQYTYHTFWGSSDSIFAYYPGTQNEQSFPFKSKFYANAISRNRVIISTRAYKSYALNTVTGKIIHLQLSNPSPDYNDRDFVVFQTVPMEGPTLLLSSTKGLLLFDTITFSIKKPVFYFGGQPLENQATIKALHRDSAGIIYLCHADGIFLLQAGKNSIQYLRNYRYGNIKIPENDVRSFAEDEQGQIWMATTNGMARLNMETGALQAFPPFAGDNPIEYPSYRALLNDGPYLWIGSSGNGLWALHKATGRYIRPLPMPGDTTRNLLQQFNSTYIWRILLLKNGNILILGGGRSFLLNPVNLRYKKMNFESAVQSSRSGMQDGTHRIWHGTSRGLWVMDSSFKTLFRIRDSFPDQRIAAFCEWKTGHMLIGTKGLYESVTTGDKIVSFNKIKAIPTERFIYCMVKDDDGNVWLGTDEGLYKYDPVRKEAELYGADEFIQSQAFNSNGAFKASDGRIFMGGWNGINYFYPKHVEPMHTKLKPVISSFSMGGNDSLWLRVPMPYRLSYQQRDIDFTISAPEYIQPFRIQYRYRLQPEAGWSHNGYSPRVRINSLPPGKYALEIAASTDGINWYRAADALIFSIKNPWWQSLAFRLIVVLLVMGVVWMIMLYRKRKRERTEMEKAVNYFALSGSRDAATTDLIWDIARNCISRLGFVDCVIYLVDEKRKMLIQKAAYGDKSLRDYEIANPIEIPIGEGITGHAAKTGTSLLVNDITKDSRYIVDDEARSAELAVPIIHDGKVIGVIDSEHPRKNFFTAEHRKTVEQIAAICSSKIARTLAVEAMQQAENKLGELNNKMMEAKFMNLRLQMNPHFLFNTLTSIQYLVVSGQTNKALKYLNVFSGFLRDLLQYAEHTVVTIEDEIRILHLYVELESLSVDETFLYDIVMDESIEQDDVMVPFMILQPFVENAIHHGLIHRLGEKRFNISIHNENDEYLLCIIEDNGIGRKKAGEIKAQKMRAARYESKGVHIVMQRLALLNEKTGKMAGLFYEDLIDNEGLPAGTRVTIHIPYYQNDDI
jgi:ligand-binding sensor domain-containing protein/putative methionine-R-sulfoxide reductase with GAF domain